jgi:hypothetical protein
MPGTGNRLVPSFSCLGISLYQLRLSTWKLLISPENVYSIPFLLFVLKKTSLSKYFEMVVLFEFVVLRQRFSVHISVC